MNVQAISQRRLSPEMASFRLLVLAFVREYLEANDGSPSYGEIANGLHSNRRRVWKAVRSLTDEGLLLRVPGPRGISLPSVRDTAIRQLRQFGFVVDEDIRLARSPGVTHRTLLPEPELDYPEDGSDEELGGDGKQAA